MTVKEMQKQFSEKQEQERNKIKAEPKKFKRFWKWILYFLIFPWKWAFINIRDWRTAIIFLIVLAVYSGSVWGFYLSALLVGGKSTELGSWLWGVGTAIWAWWLSPAGSPFILLCVCTTIGIKALFNKIKKLKKKGGK